MTSVGGIARSDESTINGEDEQPPVGSATGYPPNVWGQLHRQTYDPRHSFRISFSPRALPDTQFAIGYMRRHCGVVTTN